MDHDHNMPGMGGGGGGGAAANNTMNHKMMMMHMTFFWGKNAEILFSGWPGTRTGMYVLALVFVFALAFLIEWLSYCRLVKSEGAVAGLLQTLLYMVRVGFGYMVMLAVMSFNVGVFLAAVAGHTLGFLLFGSRFFRKADNGKITSDLPPRSVEIRC